MFIVQRMISIYLIICAIFLASNVIARQNQQRGRKYSSYPDHDNDLSLWIDEEQVKILSGKLQIFRHIATKDLFDFIAIKRK